MKHALTITIVTAWVSCAVLSLSPARAGTEAARPNILILLSDDLGYAELGVQGSKDKQGPKPGRYEMTSDAHESKDLAGVLPEVRDRLQKAYEAWSATLPPPLWTVSRNPRTEAVQPAENPKQEKM